MSVNEDNHLHGRDGQVQNGPRHARIPNYNAEQFDSGASSSRKYQDDQSEMSSQPRQQYGNDLPKLDSMNYTHQHYGYQNHNGSHVAGFDEYGREVYRVRKKRRTHRARNIILVVLAVLVVLVAVFGASGFALAQSARTVKSQAESALPLVDSMMDKASAGNMQGLSSDAQKLASVTSSVKSEMDSPLWTLATIVPIYGSDVSAAKTMVDSLDLVANSALVPLTEDLQGVSLGSLVSDGSVNVDALQKLADGLTEVSPVIQTANDQIQSIGDTHIDQITELVTKAKDSMGMLSSAADTANQIAPVLPQMLGADGQTRNYLIVAMTESEIRAAGGFPGAQGLLTVSNGKIDLGDFVSVVSIPWSQEVPITEEENTLFQGPSFNGGAMKITSGDALYNPDFPHSADRLAQFWQMNYPDSVDGVIAVDPVFLQYILSVTGGVTSPDGTKIDGSNAAKYLLSDVYWKYADNTDYQDAVFASVAGAAFDKVVSGLGDIAPTDLATAVSQGVDEGRLLIWMKNEQEESIVEDLGVSGAVSTDPTTAQLGVYVNDYSYTKSEYYLNLDTTVGEGTRNSDGSFTYQVQTTLVNTMTPEEAASLPPYLKAHNNLALSDDDLMLRVYLYAPAGGTVDNIQVSGTADLTMNPSTYNGVNVSFGEVHLQAGKTVTLNYSVTTSSQAGASLDVRSTPTAEGIR